MLAVAICQTLEMLEESSSNKIKVEPEKKEILSNTKQ